MEATVRFGWQILYRANASFFDGLDPAPLFRATESTDYLNRISASGNGLYHPIELEPTNLFHLEFRRLLKSRFNVEIREKNFPYTLSIPLIGPETRVSLFVQSLGEAQFFRSISVAFTL